MTMDQTETFTQLHPEHIKYITGVIKPTTLSSFFDIMDGISLDIRNDILGSVYYEIIQPKLSIESLNGPITIPLSIPNYSYKSFKRRYFKLAKTLSETFLVYSLVIYI